jgi:CDP-diacylglycerol--glycerol-3-phosphate 3-phosphatidyltransferase
VIDLAFGIAIWTFVLGVLLMYVVRVALVGRARTARADREGGSVLLSKHFVEYGGWMLDPLGRLLVKLGVTPDGVTRFSLVPGIGAGVALAYGWLGLAAFLGVIAALSDTLDGLVARLSGNSSESGETLDAIADRYTECAFFVGLIVHYRASLALTALSAIALVGAFMVSYTSAKAEAQQVSPPRGLMRRSERAVYMLVGAGLTPFSQLWLPASWSGYARELPMIVCIVLIAVIANISSFIRVGSIRNVLRQAEAAQSSDIKADSSLRQESDVAGSLVATQQHT